jgi:hypothetical protein
MIVTDNTNQVNKETAAGELRMMGNQVAGTWMAGAWSAGTWVPGSWMAGARAAGEPRPTDIAMRRGASRRTGCRDGC